MVSHFGLFQIHVIYKKEIRKWWYVIVSKNISYSLSSTAANYRKLGNYLLLARSLQWTCVHCLVIAGRECKMIGLLCHSLLLIRERSLLYRCNTILEISVQCDSYQLGWKYRNFGTTQYKMYVMIHNRGLLVYVGSLSPFQRNFGIFCFLDEGPLCLSNITWSLFIDLVIWSEYLITICNWN